MSDTHKVLLIATGGTIAGQVATGEEETDSGAQDGEHLMAAIGPTVGYLNKQHGITIEHSYEDLCNIDSSDILPEHWTKMAGLIKEKYDDFDSFLITHGTNTLGYTCAALSFALENSNKPIILTGSQVPANQPGSDGLTNLQNALRVAVWRRENNPIKGVMAVFASHIITGTRVKKDTEFDYDAFKSFSTGAIGRIGRIININETNLEKHLGYLSTPQFHPARKAKSLRCFNDFDMNIASLTEFPGMDSEFFKTLVGEHGVRGFILRAFGAGDPCSRHMDVFKYLRRKKIPLVVTTQAPNGNANFQVNESGAMLLDEHLAIPAYDMSIESQTTKLAWLLAKESPSLTYEQICEAMITDIRGEINVKWEVGL